ncbi:unnamed protein product [Arctogadus glacialis]
MIPEYFFLFSVANILRISEWFGLTWLPQNKSPRHATVVSDFVEDQTVGDCIQEEGLFYVAGWLVQVLQKEEIVQAYPHCEVLLLGTRHQDHSYATSEDHPFLEAKKYTATANLMRPLEGFFAAIQLLEGEFARNINAFWPLTQITKKIERALGSLGVFNSLFSSHPEHASLL